jgi:hypothetical protein
MSHRIQSLPNTNWCKLVLVLGTECTLEMSHFIKNTYWATVKKREAACVLRHVILVDV